MNGESCEIDNRSCCTPIDRTTNPSKDHWEKVYSNSDEKKLGWYQKNANPSLELINQSNISKNELILDIGSGASVLIDQLLHLEYQNIIATDISETALNITKKRLDQKQATKIDWIVDDITNPDGLHKIKKVSLWHDRAVFHFLKTKKDRDTYLDLLKASVMLKKHVIIASFNFDSADTCSGLPIEKYDEKKLQDFLGENFKLVNHFNYDYTMPSGAIRPYIYTLFQKIK